MTTMTTMTTNNLHNGGESEPVSTSSASTSTPKKEDHENIAEANVQPTNNVAVGEIRDPPAVGSTAAVPATIPTATVPSTSQPKNNIDNKTTKSKKKPSTKNKTSLHKRTTSKGLGAAAEKDKSMSKNKSKDKDKGTKRIGCKSDCSDHKRTKVKKKKRQQGELR